MCIRGDGDAEEKQTQQGASGQRATLHDFDSVTEDRRRELTTGHHNGAKVADPCLTTWPDSLPGVSQIQIIQVTGPAAKDFLEVIYLLDAKAQEFTKCNPRAYQMEIREQTDTVVLEYEEALQWQRAPEKQQTAAHIHEDVQMGQVTHAAHENQPSTGLMLQRASPEMFSSCT
jgi:hypothetical protein